MLNKIIIMGRLTRDPELRRTGSGTAVTSFSLAVDRDFKSQSGEKETDFIDVVAWRSTAEFVSKYFTKGQLMAVTGSIQPRNYEARNGNKRKAVEIQATEVTFASSRREGGSMGGDPSYSQPRASAPAQPAAFSEPAPAYSSGSSEDFEEILGDDDLPF